MLLRNRLFTPDPVSPKARPGYGLLAPDAIKVLARLTAHRVDYILIGSVAELIVEGAASAGPVAIVPSPYRRNLERLANLRTLLAEDGLTLEARTESSSRYQEMLYETRAHEVADGVRVEVASVEDLRRLQRRSEARAVEIRVSRASAHSAPAANPG